MYHPYVKRGLTSLSHHICPICLECLASSVYPEGGADASWSGYWGGRVALRYKNLAREQSGARRMQMSFALFLAFTAAWAAQGAAEQSVLRADSANEPMQMGSPAQKDAEAARDAQTGWYAN